jgi:hypothetical protein
MLKITKNDLQFPMNANFLSEVFIFTDFEILIIPSMINWNSFQILHEIRKLLNTYVFSLPDKKKKTIYGKSKTTT